jgi:hypothetical protein
MTETNPKSPTDAHDDAPPRLAEPESPMWLPAVGALLFLLAGIIWLQTPAFSEIAPDPAAAHPAEAEPVAAQPSQAQPVGVQPKLVQPAQDEPAAVQPARVQPVGAPSRPSAPTPGTSLGKVDRAAPRLGRGRPPGH